MTVKKKKKFVSAETSKKISSLKAEKAELKKRVASLEKALVKGADAYKELEAECNKATKVIEVMKKSMEGLE